VIPATKWSSQAHFEPVVWGLTRCCSGESAGKIVFRDLKSYSPFERSGRPR
jgi:hypothetical protein